MTPGFFSSAATVTITSDRAFLRIRQNSNGSCPRRDLLELSGNLDHAPQETWQHFRDTPNPDFGPVKLSVTMNLLNDAYGFP